MAYILNDAKRVVGRVNNTGANNYVIHVTLEEKSTSTANNTSELYYKVWITAENDTYITDVDGASKYMSGWAFAGGQITGYININNASFASQANTGISLAYKGYGSGYAQSYTLLEGTKSIAHNSDGALTVNVVAGITNNYTYNQSTPNNGSISKSAPLTTIARASTISASNATMGASTSIKITAASTAFSHVIDYNIGNSGWKNLTTVAAGTATYTFNVPDWCSYLPAGSTSGTVTYRVTTKSGSTTIGDTKTTTATISMPGASTATVPSSFTLDSSGNITIKRGLSSYTHTVTYTIGSKKNVAIATKTSNTTVAWSPDTSLGGEFPSSNTGGATIYVTTYAPSQSGSGTTQVGSTQSYSTTIGVPSGAGPISNGFTASFVHTSGSKAAEWGIAIKGYSKMTWSFSLNSSKLYGASVSYTFSYGGQSGSAASGTTGLFSQAANAKPKIVVKDSRNNSITVETSSAMVVYDYGAPVIVSSYAYRSDANGTRKDDGTYVTKFINAKTDYSCGGKNTITTQERWKLSTGSWSVWGDVPNNQQSTSANWGITKSYQIERRVIDSLGTPKSVTYTIPTASITFNLKEGGKAWAFGGYAQEDGKLDVYGNGINLKTTDESRNADIHVEHSNNVNATANFVATSGGTIGIYDGATNQFLLSRRADGLAQFNAGNFELRSIDSSDAWTRVQALSPNGTKKAGLLMDNRGAYGIYGDTDNKWLILRNDDGAAYMQYPLYAESGLRVRGGVSRFVPTAISPQGGSAGWCEIVKITVTGNYCNSPFVIGILQRGVDQVELQLSLSNANTTTPAVNYLSITKGKANPDNFYVVQNGSTYQVFVRKSENYDTIAIAYFYASSYMNDRSGWTFPLTYYASLPSGTQTKASRVVGMVLGGGQTSSKSMANNAWTGMGAVTLPSGSWIVCGMLITNASSGGYLQACLHTGEGGTDTNLVTMYKHGTTDNRLECVVPLDLGGSATVTFDCLQNTGATINGRGLIRAMRIV